jgi:hypothetical protein
MNGFGFLGVQKRRQEHVCGTKRGAKRYAIQDSIQDNSPGEFIGTVKL